MNKSKVWELLRPIVVLVAISCICTAALSTTSVITAPVIAEQMAAAEQAAKLEVLPEGADFAPVSEEEMATLPDAIVAAEKAGNGAGFVFTTETKGFGGMARAMFGVNADGAIVKSKVLDHGETEGIGSKVMKNGSPYQQQLIGMTGADVDNIVAHSGASFSSGAMKLAVTSVFDAYTLLSGGTLEGPPPPATLTPAVIAEYYGNAEFTDVGAGLVSDAGTVVYASGYGAFSDVLVAVFFDANDSIIGLHIDASGETPEKGQQLMTREYTDKYIGAKSGKDVDVVSGASFTSWAVQDSVDYALANLQTVKEAA